MNLRDFARGKPCQVRLFGICNFDETTTVLAHIRRGGVAGVGRKPHDLVGVHACSDCHRAIDVTGEATDTDILEALCRTLEVVGNERD